MIFVFEEKKTVTQKWPLCNFDPWIKLIEAKKNFHSFSNFSYFFNILFVFLLWKPWENDKGLIFQSLQFSMFQLLLFICFEFGKNLKNNIILFLSF